MQARITKSFRAAEGQDTRKYTPGDVAEGQAAELAVSNGWGVEVDVSDEADSDRNANKKAKKAPKNKAATVPKNKGKASGD